MYIWLKCYKNVLTKWPPQKLVKKKTERKRCPGALWLMDIRNCMEKRTVIISSLKFDCKCVLYARNVSGCRRILKSFF